MANNKNKNMDMSSRNTASITNPKTKNQNTTSSSYSISKGQTVQPSNSKGRCCNTGSTNMPSKGKSQQTSDKSQSDAMYASGKNISQSTKSNKGISASSGKKTNWLETAQEHCMLTDMDIISDVLGGQKSLIKMYGTALCETDCENLRGLINNQMSECATDQYDAFLYMNQRGMYPTENAPAPKIKQAKKKYSDYEKAIKI